MGLNIDFGTMFPGKGLRKVAPLEFLKVSKGL